MPALMLQPARHEKESQPGMTVHVFIVGRTKSARKKRSLYGCIVTVLSFLSEARHDNARCSRGGCNHECGAPACRAQAQCRSLRPQRQSWPRWPALQPQEGWAFFFELRLRPATQHARVRTTRLGACTSSRPGRPTPTRQRRPRSHATQAYVAGASKATKGPQKRGKGAQTRGFVGPRSRLPPASTSTITHSCRSPYLIPVISPPQHAPFLVPPCVPRLLWSYPRQRRDNPQKKKSSIFEILAQP
jgi:hypothetical protein